MIAYGTYTTLAAAMSTGIRPLVAIAEALLPAWKGAVVDVMINASWSRRLPLRVLYHRVGFVLPKSLLGATVWS